MKENAMRKTVFLIILVVSAALAVIIGLLLHDPTWALTALFVLNIAVNVAAIIYVQILFVGSRNEILNLELPAGWRMRQPTWREIIYGDRTADLFVGLISVSIFIATCVPINSALIAKDKDLFGFALKYIPLIAGLPALAAIAIISGRLKTVRRLFRAGQETECYHIKNTIFEARAYSFGTPFRRYYMYTEYGTYLYFYNNRFYKLHAKLYGQAQPQSAYGLITLEQNFGRGGKEIVDRELAPAEQERALAFLRAHFNDRKLIALVDPKDPSKAVIAQGFMSDKNWKPEKARKALALYGLYLACIFVFAFMMVSLNPAHLQSNLSNVEKYWAEREKEQRIKENNSNATER